MNQTYADVAERALARFRKEGITGDVLQNTVQLSSGETVNGNWMACGMAHERAAREQIERNVARGLDVSKWSPTTHQRVVTITATEADRRLILQDAFRQLADPKPFTIRTWANVSYELFQSPQTKNGSDAVIRTFLAAAGEYRMSRVPKFPHDIDLRAMTMNQRDFIDFITDFDDTYSI
ncbi:hypothetical protein ACFYO1_02195 [Nocardia sp. NPDC006044]|uniref:hypothetical protein n=1 Tax=Nocardia sp. NPDC006044 TaxID=3364306 RepID=UPI003691BF14